MRSTTSAPVEGELAQWVGSLEPSLAKKLARARLIPNPEAKPSATLGGHVANYFEKQTDVKDSTVTHWRHTKRSRLEFFGVDRPLQSITRGDATDFERWLKSGDARVNRYAGSKADEGLAINTVRKRIGDANQIFQEAVNRGLLAQNPFEGLNSTIGSNRDRDHFIDRATADKVFDACPNSQWRLLFALSRYGGLRCPSEHLVLIWGDVNWAEGKMLIRSSKTEHHEGKGTRLVPIFPELRLYLERVWEEAEPGTSYVITQYRTNNANLRTQLDHIIRSAGLKPWPKLFHNLRASRATELANEYPAHVAAAWLGHSTLVANKHYWQVTEADFERATGRSEEGGAQVAQNAAQQAHATECTESQKQPTAHEKAQVLQADATLCATPQNRGMGVTGTELTSVFSENTHLPEISAAESGAISTDFASDDADLTKIISAWPKLSATIRTMLGYIVERELSFPNGGKP